MIRCEAPKDNDQDLPCDTFNRLVMNWWCRFYFLPQGEKERKEIKCKYYKEEND